MGNPYVIDKKKPEFADIPDTLEGEVLLERLYDGDGNMTGIITATLDVAKATKGKSQAEKKSAGWEKYQHVLDAIE